MNWYLMSVEESTGAVGAKEQLGTTSCCVSVHSVSTVTLQSIGSPALRLVMMELEEEVAVVDRD